MNKFSFFLLMHLSSLYSLLYSSFSFGNYCANLQPTQKAKCEKWTQRLPHDCQNNLLSHIPKFIKYGTDFKGATKLFVDGSDLDSHQVGFELAFRYIHDQKALDITCLTDYLQSSINQELSNIQSNIENDLKNHYSTIRNQWTQALFTSINLPKEDLIQLQIQPLPTPLVPVVKKNETHSYPLHKDLWPMIFSHLDPLTIKAMGQVNRDFYHLSLIAYPKILEYYFPGKKFPPNIFTKFAALLILKKVYSLRKLYPYLMESFPVDPFSDYVPSYIDFVGKNLKTPEVVNREKMIIEIEKLRSLIL